MTQLSLVWLSVIRGLVVFTVVMLGAAVGAGAICHHWLHSAWRETGVALVICLIPGWVFLGLLGVSAGRPELGLLPLMVMVLRLGLAGAAIMLLPRFAREWQAKEFLCSVAGLYLVSLVLETGLAWRTLEASPGNPS